jgi:hypothetical protein
MLEQKEAHYFTCFRAVCTWTDSERKKDTDAIYGVNSRMFSIHFPSKSLIEEVEHSFRSKYALNCSHEEHYFIVE